MATITDRLRQVLAARDPSRVGITIEAEPGRGDAVTDQLGNLGIDFERVDVRRKTIFQATVTRGQLGTLESSEAIAVLDHSPTFTPLGAAPGGGMTEAVPADDINQISLRQAIEEMDVPEAWDALGHRGEGASIGMVDSPISERHPSIEDSVVETESNAGADTHGTWVASALCGSAFETAGGTVQGVAPDADLYAHGALSGGGAGVSEIAEGINFCIESGADVINLSFGGEHSEILRSVVGEAIESGAVVVSSIGNSGPGLKSATCPAHHGEVLAVGSMDTDESVASFSSRGPGWSGEIKPDLVGLGGGASLAGGDVLVTESVLGAAPGNQSQYLVGTSMAGPQVAGIAALKAAQVKQG